MPTKVELNSVVPDIITSQWKLAVTKNTPKTAADVFVAVVFIFWWNWSPLRSWRSFSTSISWASLSGTKRKIQLFNILYDADYTIVFKHLIKKKNYTATCLTVATQRTFFYKLANQQVTQQRIIENMSFCILWTRRKISWFANLWKSLLGGHGKARRTVNSK